MGMLSAELFTTLSLEHRVHDVNTLKTSRTMALNGALITDKKTSGASKLNGEPVTGTSAVVIPVRRERQRLALKLSWPHHEASVEHVVLRAWDGHGSVRLIAANPRDFALLLERCDPAAELTGLSALDAAERIGELHDELIHPALPQLTHGGDRTRPAPGARGWINAWPRTRADFRVVSSNRGGRSPRTSASMLSLSTPIFTTGTSCSRAGEATGPGWWRLTRNLSTVSGLLRCAVGVEPLG